MKTSKQPLRTILMIAALSFVAPHIALAAPLLIERDKEAAGAILAHKVFWEAAVQHCKQYVPEKVHEKFDLVWADWEDVNFDYIDVAKVIRGQMIKEAQIGQGAKEAVDLTIKFGELVEKTRADSIKVIEDIPAENRQQKCLGIVVVMAQGKLDIPVAVEADAEHLENRVEEMGW